MKPLRYPRTLNEAFGPYADRTPISEPRDTGYPLAWWLAVCAAGLGAIVLTMWPAAPL